MKWAHLQAKNLERKELAVLEEKKELKFLPTQNALIKNHFLKQVDGREGKVEQRGKNLNWQYWAEEMNFVNYDLYLDSND